jgi:tetratricopeptide (TPR) repeat protein
MIALFSRMMPRKELTLILISFLFAGFVIAADTPAEAPDAAMFLKARLAAEDERFDDALTLIDDLLRRHSGNAVLHHERARILVNMRQFPQAEGALRRAISIDPLFHDARKLMGRLLLDRSSGDRARVNEALEHLTMAFQLQPHDMATGLTISQVLLGLGRLEEARNIVEGLLERTPEHRSINYQYAQILSRMGQRTEAAEYLERVVVQEPFYRPAISQLLEIYEEQGQFSEAADVMGILVEQEPLNLEMQRQQAFFLLRGKRFEEARDLLESLLREDPGDHGASFMLAEVLSELGEHAEAEQYYRAVLLVRPDDPELLIGFGLNQLTLRELDTAATQFHRLLELQGLPPRIRALAATQLAAIDHKNEEYDTALARTRGLLEIEGMLNIQAVNIHLDVLRRREDHQQALRVLDRLIASQGSEPVLQARKIQFLHLSGREDQAMKLALAQARGELESGLGAAQMYAQMDLYEQALEVLVPMRARWSENVSYLFQLGAAYERTGQFEKAEAAFQELLERDPDHAPAQNYLGYMWADRGIHLEEAERLILGAVSQYPRNGAYVDSLGWVYFRMGRYDLAEKHLLDAAELIPDDATIQEHLGDLFVRKGQLERALDRYDQALKLEPEDEQALRAKINDLRERIAARLEQ